MSVSIRRLKYIITDNYVLKTFYYKNKLLEMENLTTKVLKKILSYKKFKLKNKKNLILILKTLKYLVVLMLIFKIIFLKPFLFTKDQIKHMQIKWCQAQKSNQFQG